MRRTLTFTLTIALPVAGLLACAAASEGSPQRKWYPGHYLQTSYTDLEPTREVFDEVVKEPLLTGIEILYWWRALEPRKDDYSGIDRVVKDLDFMQGHGKKVMIMLSDKLWHVPDEAAVRRKLPDYILDDPEYRRGAYPVANRWVIKLWDPVVNERFNKLIRELGKRVDSHPALAGVHTMETATGGRGDLPQGDYTAQRYIDAMKSNLTAAAEAFPRTPFMYGVNWLAGPGPSGNAGLRQVITHAEKLGLGFGGPNVHDTELFDPKPKPYHALYLERIGSVPTYGQIEWGEYTKANPEYSARFGVEKMGLNFISWHYARRGARTKSGWDQGKLVEYLRATDAAINRAVPANMR